MVTFFEEKTYIEDWECTLHDAESLENVAWVQDCMSYCHAKAYNISFQRLSLTVNSWADSYKNKPYRQTHCNQVTDYTATVSTFTLCLS